MHGVEDIHRIAQRYVDGELSEEEIKEIEIRLKSEDELQKHVEAYQLIKDGFDALSVETFQERMNGWEEKHQSNSENERNESNIRSMDRRWLWIASIAAAAIVLLLFWIQPFSSEKLSSEELFAQNYQPYENLITSRDVAELSQLEVGMSRYEGGNYEEAYIALKEYSLSNPTDMRPLLYLGVCCMETSRFNEAIGYFEAAENEPKYREQASWYSALMYLKMNDLVKATELLVEIESSSVHYRKAQAKKMLELLTK